MTIKDVPIGVELTAPGHEVSHMGEIVLTLAGDAVYQGEVMDMTEALGVWEGTLGGTFAEWAQALTALDARR